MSAFTISATLPEAIQLPQTALLTVGGLGTKIPLATPMIANAAMSLRSVSVIANSLRLRGAKL